ncbi:acyl-CoA N-acyltransferase [Gilbertella persicaria]|uniref:acyl-CoA N-acyltransferase n=1 Tax=Gilbertella persicaria TaxID=101096 RepID=UPI00221FF23D|nr:acyl-CoA N-acyltransferase [Gilbertella persicaria]KAI8081821.1 acyl-CoA N-acyltransferase [Gilbertella persicaria]
MGNPLESYIIRAATESDMPQVLEIYNERILNSTCLFMYDQVPLENRLTWFKELKSKGYPVIVAAEKKTNKAIAYACYGGFRPHTAFILTTEISLYIHQAHQRRGLGSVLLAEMLRIGKELKFRNLIAGITAENEGSVILFSKFGFKKVGHIHDAGYKFDRFLDIVFLEYITDTQVQPDQKIPAFKAFPYDTYVYRHALE